MILISVRRSGPTAATHYMEVDAIGEARVPFGGTIDSGFTVCDLAASLVPFKRIKDGHGYLCGRCRSYLNKKLKEGTEVKTA